MLHGITFTFNDQITKASRPLVTQCTGEIFKTQSIRATKLIYYEMKPSRTKAKR